MINASQEGSVFQPIYLMPIFIYLQKKKRFEILFDNSIR